MCAAISAIDKDSVHRICSGQVVLTLAVAVKELVENSLDAGATSIEIRLKEYGCDSIEVVDNGSGVEERNYEGLTSKHCTSKIGSFEDVEGVSTFGFRGEALSSLCAMSKMAITTRHASMAVGSRLEFDSSGCIVTRLPFPRLVGTTVCMQQLFHTLPVRHKEFLRNAKKEFSKMVNLLTAYAVVCTNVRLTCTNQVASGKKAVVLLTNGNSSMRGNIADIFGVKQLESLVDFESSVPTDDICEEFNVSVVDASIPFRIAGLVSSCSLTSGRSTTDRQYYYINGRPCDLPKVSRVVNEAYHFFNRHQYPCVVLDVAFSSGSVDVNVTPDKRLIMIEHELLLLAVIKASLLRLYAPLAASVLQCHDNDRRGATAADNSSKYEKGAEKDKPATLKRTLQALYAKLDQKDTSTKQHRMDNYIIKNDVRSDSAQAVKALPSASPTVLAEPRATTAPSSLSACHGAKEEFVFSMELARSDCITSVLDKDVAKDDGLALRGLPHCGAERVNDECLDESLLAVLPACAACLDGSLPVSLPTCCCTAHQGSSGNEAALDCNSEESVAIACRLTAVGSCGQEHSQATTTNDCSRSMGSQSNGGEFSLSSTSSHVASTFSAGCRPPPTGLDDFDASRPSGRRKETLVRFSLADLRAAAALMTATSDSEASQRGNHGLHFKAKIAPSENIRAEEELNKALGKERFNDLVIIGQFNLGFIVARLERDLFIIDQHASDEKYNFEMLQKNTFVKRQRLMHPMPLHLTTANELVLMDNLDVFARNGFEFAVDENELPTHRVRMSAQPVSKNWSFGKEDIDEMLFMLGESPGRLCRPTRVRAMFASRACRKSVMIGTSLREAEMTKLVRHMAELDQPWNCPHGRPTIRHMVNLDLITKDGS